MKIFKKNKLVKLVIIAQILLLNTNTNAIAKSPTNMNENIKFIEEFNNIKEYRLKNGLKILLKENHSIPLVTFSIWYKVGSRNEGDGIRGIAHFLEHMMFKGTKKYKKGQIAETIQGYGGSFNAFTFADGTAYYETISPKYLDKVIDIESDRMKNSIINEDELNLERTVVISELEGDSNDPSFLLDEKVKYEAYTNSPYKHPVIGYLKDLNKITSKEMKEFYRKYYSPNNATIVLAGDFEINDALNLINKGFKDIPKSNIETNAINIDLNQTSEKRIKLERSGSYKLLQISYHIPASSHPDINALNVLEEYIMRGKNSPLKKSLIEKGYATEVAGGCEINKDPGLFNIIISLTPNANHKTVENIVIKELDKIKDSIAKEEIESAKKRLKSSFYFNQDGTYSESINLGYYEVINNWKNYEEQIPKLLAITEDDLKDVLKKYFSKENRTIGYFIPKLRKGEKYKPQQINTSRTQSYKANEKIKQLTTRQNSSNKRFSYKKINLKDGSKIFLYSDIKLPITYISGVIPGGSSLLTKDNEAYAALISRTLEKGSKKYPLEKINNFFDRTGSSIDFSYSEDSFRFEIASLNENLNETLDYFIDILLNPTFPSNEVKKEKGMIVAEIIKQKDDINEIAKRKISQIIYPKDHPYYSNDFDEDIKLLNSVKLKKLQDFHKVLIRNRTALFSIVSSSTESEQIINKLNNDLNTDKKKTTGEINIPDSILRDTPNKEIIYVKDKLQSDVYLAHATEIKRNHPDFYKVNIANQILGGGTLNSRLIDKVRDESGLAYYTYSYISSAHNAGDLGIFFGSNNDNVDKAINLIQQILASFVSKGVTKEELDKAKASLINSFTSKYLSTYKSICNTVLAIEFYNLGNDYINDYPQIINSLKLEDVNNAIKKYFFPSKLNIVIAGEYSKEKQKK